jgi:hypothetical protein
MIAGNIAKCIRLHQAIVTQIVVSCKPAGRAELGQEVLCQTTGPSGSCSLLIRRKTAAPNHYNLISKQACAEPGGWSCSAETMGVKGPIERNRLFTSSGRIGFSGQSSISGIRNFAHETRVKNLFALLWSWWQHLRPISRSNSTRMYGLTFQKIVNLYSYRCGNLISHIFIFRSVHFL